MAASRFTKCNWQTVFVVASVGVLLPSVAAITSITSTNETTVSSLLSWQTSSSSSSSFCLDASVCSCDKAYILKCFCQSNAYFLNFQLSDFGTDFDLIQIGDCRQITFYGLPFSPRPPEILQFFDVENLFQDRHLQVQPQLPFSGLVARPIKRIEFLNVTVSYLALNDFYALNEVENFVFKDCSIKVLGGRPKSMNFSSNVQRMYIVNSKIIEMRKDSLDLQNMHELLIANSTIHLWQPGSVRVTNANKVLVSDCHVQNMEGDALTTVNVGEVVFQRNRIHLAFDDAFNRIRDVDFYFVDNVLETLDPMAFGGLFASSRIQNFTNNTLPCKDPLCLGSQFQLVADNHCADKSRPFHKYFISTVLARNVCPQVAFSSTPQFSGIWSAAFLLLTLTIVWTLHHN